VSGTPSTSASIVAPKLAKPDAEVAFETGDAPQNPVAGYGSLWVPAHHAGAVLRVDVKTGKLLARINTGDSPGNILVGAGKVWVAQYADTHTLVAIDPATNRIALRVRLPGESCCQPAILGSTVWVTAADASGPSIVAVNAATGHLGKRIHGVDGPIVVGHRLWASQDGLLVEVNTTTGDAVGIGAPPNIGIVAAPAAQGLTWAWDAVAGAAYGLNSDGTLGRTVKGPGGASLGGSDGMVVTSGDTVWATDGVWNLWRIDAGATAAVQVARTVADLLCVAGDGHGGVWVSFFNTDKVQHFSDTH
jgi:hypothetical protein